MKENALPSLPVDFKQELEQMEKVYDLIIEFFVNYSFQLVGALIIFLIGLWISHKVSKFVNNLLTKNNIDVTLSKFISNVVRIIVILMVGIIALGKLGISVTPFIAAIGAASLGIGLALQGMLSNYAAGITIIITRPFVVGNTITVLDVTGVVKEIKLGMVILTNEEGEDISIPNKHIMGEVIHNSFENKLIHTEIGISYDAQPENAIEILENTLKAQAFFNDSIEYQIGIESFGDSSINIGIRFWVPTENYFDCKYKSHLAFFNALKEANISIPFPQREVKILQ